MVIYPRGSLETGVCAPTVVDYRNLAHGVTRGIHRNIKQTSIVILGTPEDRELARATLMRLPRFKTSHVVFCETNRAGLLGETKLIAAVSGLIAATSAARGVEPSGGQGPPGHRALYNLGYHLDAKPRPGSPGRPAQAALTWPPEPPPGLALIAAGTFNWDVTHHNGLTITGAGGTPGNVAAITSDYYGHMAAMVGRARRR